MLLGGLQKSTVIDYPGFLACTVFTVGCNFRCPFCHNRSLVTLANFKESGEAEVKEEEFFEFLRKRLGLLDGVCITGGEPTLHPDLPDFCRKVKDLGLLVKLDTNGTNPEMLEELYRQKLLDYVAMDLKTYFDDYSSVVGKNVDLVKVLRSVNLILMSGLPFELRTTVVPALHTKTSLVKLATDIKKAADDASFPVKNILWYLQNFRPQNCLEPSFNDKDGFSETVLLGFVTDLKLIIPRVQIRV